MRLTPRAKRPGYLGVAADAGGRPRLLVAVAAPPVEGAANAAMIDVLAAAWRVPRSALSIRSGAGSREKVVHLAGDPDALGRHLGDWLQARPKPGDRQIRTKTIRGGTWVK
ncbi:MAG: DUF167 domain-containing protein [Alphaproteobacteria bacterium]